MDQLNLLRRKRSELKHEGEREMQRYQRVKDLEGPSRHKRPDKHSSRHKTMRSRYEEEMMMAEDEVDATHRSREHERRGRKREHRSHKSGDPYRESSSSSKETRRGKERMIQHRDTQEYKMAVDGRQFKVNTRVQCDEENTIEVNIREEEEEKEEEVEGEEREEGEEENGGTVEEGELEGDNREADDDYANPYKLTRSKFDEEEEEEEEEEEDGEEEKEEVEEEEEEGGKERDLTADNDSARKSNGEEERDNDEDEDEDQEILITEIKKDVQPPPTKDRAPTPPSPLTPKATPVSKVDSPSLHLPPFYPAIQGCRNVEEFHCLNRVEEGTYGVVYRAVDRKTQDIVALKRLKMEKESEGFPITSLREINTLLSCTHENVVKIREVVVGSNMDKIYLVMDFVEHDLKSLMEYMKEPFLIGEVKTLMTQLLKGVAHLHDNWVVHRDLKTSNLLLSNQGILKIGDFGLAREYGSPLKPYTPIVVTLWYRAPELLLGQKIYSTPIDLWSAGCIFGELVQKKPLFPGRSELDQLNKLFKELGSPTEKIWPGVSQLPGYKTLSFGDHHFNRLSHKFDKLMSARGFDLLNLLLTYCPEKRLTAEEALKHNFFSEVPIPVEPAMFPTWPSKSELRQGKIKIGRTPKAPSGGEAYSKMVAEEEMVSTGFTLKTAQKPTGFALRF